VIDYAETRTDEIVALVGLMTDSSIAHPVRLLLLSRSAGAWWTLLAETHDPGIIQRISLQPLAGPGQTRHDVYAAAVTGLARRLATLPDLSAGDQPWPVRAERLAAHPPNLDDPRLGNALTLQITALIVLLNSAAGQEVIGVFGEREFASHERGYIRKSAATRRLFDPGILSDRADDDDRAAEAWAALERALAGVILLGPRGASQAQAVGALASEVRTVDVTNWLAALYPPAGEEFHLGVVQPDRLAELLLGPVLIREPSLLAKIGAMADSIRDGYAILFTLMRTAAHPEFDRVGEMTAELIASRAGPLAVAAPVLATALPRSGPLLEGLILLGRRDVDSFKKHAYVVLDQLRYSSVGGAMFYANLLGVVADQILRPLAEDNPEAYLPDLALRIRDLGVRLSQAGQHHAALEAAQEAVTIYRQLAAGDRDAYLPGLASALVNLGNRWADAGESRDALASGEEAVNIYRQLAGADDDTYDPGLASALNNFGNRLGEAGEFQAAVAAAQEAVDVYRRLAATSPGVYRRGLASALINLGSHLGEAREFQAAVAAAQEAVDLYRQLVASNPDTHSPDLASALNNLGSLLGEAGQSLAALVVVREAIIIHRQLVASNPDTYLRGLVVSQANLSKLLVEVGREVEIVEAWKETIASLPDAATRLTLSVVCARYLLSQILTASDAAIELLVNALAAPALPSQIEADARQLLRNSWREDPDSVDAVWQSVSAHPIPDWMYLTDDEIDSVAAWINTETWAQSLQYLRDHSDLLLSDATPIALDELSLSDKEGLIGQHRDLLDMIHENGLDNAYKRIMGIDVLESWLAAPDWGASRAFLHDHPELLREDTLEMLEQLTGDRDIDRVHQALLILAQTPEGIDQAYKSLEDVQSLQPIVRAAVADQDAIRLMACSDIEIMHGRFFAGMLYTILAALLKTFNCGGYRRG
jgi:tetratricopeptide (TPR) repeat protein